MQSYSENRKSLIRVCHLNIKGDFSNAILVWQEFLTLVNRLSGVCVLSSAKHDFPGGGFTGLVLLSESHAAIHTWPEFGRAWVELATCGDPRAIDEFRLAYSNQISDDGD